MIFSIIISKEDHHHQDGHMPKQKNICLYDTFSSMDDWLFIKVNYFSQTELGRCCGQNEK